MEKFAKRLNDPDFDKTVRENAARRKRETRERKKSEAEKENVNPNDEDTNNENSTTEDGRKKPRKRSSMSNSPALNHKRSLSTSNQTLQRVSGDKLRKQNLKEKNNEIDRLKKEYKRL